MENVNVLVVEDNPVNAELLLEMLCELGCTSAVVENGRLAIDHFKRESYDAVLMDCQMPVMDGFEATREVRAFERQSDRARTPIIAVTANVTENDRLKCMQAGMDDFVKKPFTFQQLDAVLCRWVAACDNAFDQEVMKELEATHQDLFPQLVTAFCQTLVAQLTRLEAAAAVFDRPMLEKLSRSLHRSSTTLGVRPVSELTERVRLAVQKGDEELALAAVRELATQRDSLISGLMQRIQSK